MIPFEKFSHSSSLAYFSYEKDLHLFDPIISNMVSERYRCAIYSDFDDEEDEADFVYESEEEEFLDPKKKEDDLVSALMQSSNIDIMFGSFGQESNLDIVQAIPIKIIKPKFEGFTVKTGEINCSFIDASSFMDPEYKVEENSQNIGFDLKSKTDVHFSKNVLPTSTDSVCISHMFHSSNLFRRSCLELGDPLIPIVVPSPAKIVESVDLVSTKASEIRSFICDPGKVSKHTFVKGCITFFKK